MLSFINKKMFAILCFIVFTTMLFFAPDIVFINTTPSIPTGFYLRIPYTTLRKGDIVCYMPPQEVLDEIMKLTTKSPEQTYFIKRVGALKGDTYKIDPETRAFSINNKYIGIAREKNNDGIPMPDNTGTHIVGENEFLPIAPFLYSFDGRYTGTVPLDAIISRAIPLITFSE